MSSASMASPIFEVRDLGTLGGLFSFGYSINNKGQVTGEANTANSGLHAFIWDKYSGMQDLIPDKFGSTGRAINNNGVVAGGVTESQGSRASAFTWTPPSSFQNLNIPGSDIRVATGINDSGTVVGVSNGAYSWNPSDGQTGLPSLGGSFTFATDINGAGQIAGSASDSDDANRIVSAVRWEPTGTITTLGTLGGLGATGYAVNEAGHVVGNSYLSDLQTTHAFFWSDTTGMVDIGLPINAWSYAADLNDRQQAVGWSYDFGNSGETNPILWDLATGDTWNLNDLLAPQTDFTRLIQAFGINNQGQIVGHGVASSGRSHAFILTPIGIPSPAPMLLMAFGLGMVLLRSFVLQITLQRRQSEFRSFFEPRAEQQRAEYFPYQHPPPR